jgi:pSer/pThr/pTyr-binding forkhead associated (FHA) protein
MNSSSGTFLEGEKLTPNTPYSLESGSVFTVGDTSFEYQMVGDFEENYGVTTAKATGEKFETSTKLQGGSEWREALQEELNKANGNPRVAAENMGIETDVFMQMMQQANIGSDDE